VLLAVARRTRTEKEGGRSASSDEERDECAHQCVPSLPTD
jgi:hypothetical protein